MNVSLAERTEQLPLEGTLPCGDAFAKPVPSNLTAWTIVAGTLVACAPLALMLDPNLLVGGDYWFIQWTTGYVGEYFRQHLYYPNTLNTSGFVGWMMLPFYGFGFFPIAGTISALTGAALALRIVFATLFTLQFWTVHKTCVALTKDRPLAFVVATLCSWSIYPLTNLYNRGSVAEVVATAFLTCSFCCLLKLILLPSKEHTRSLALGVGLYFTAAAITHPITFQFGTLFMLAFGLALLPKLDMKQVLKWAVPNLILTAVVVSPWVYMIATALAKPLSATCDLMIAPNNLDSIWTRLAPFPYDGRALTTIGPPFLDMQINVPLLLLCLTMSLSFCRAGAIKQIMKPPGLACLLSVGLFLFTICVSAVPEFWRLFGHTFEHLQFGYRAITYINLSLLSWAATLGFLFTESTSSSADWRRWKEYTISVCVALALIGLVVKLHRGAAVASNHTREEATLFGRRYALTLMEAGAVPYSVYLSPATFGHVSPTDVASSKTINIPIGAGKNFGRTEPLALNLKTQTLIVTDVAPFPWNHLVLDRQKVPPLTIGTTKRRGLGGDSEVLCLVVPPGPHSLDYAFECDRVWAILNVLSRIVFVFWVIAAIVPSKRRAFNAPNLAPTG